MEQSSLSLDSVFFGLHLCRKSWPKVLVFTLKLARKHEIFSTRTTKATTSSLSQPILQLELYFRSRSLLLVDFMPVKNVTNFCFCTTENAEENI
ncbi:unnamed protein product [Camellia sinensis]